MEQAAQILVVDDDVPMLRATTRILTREGYGVITAIDGPSALRAARMATYGIDLLVTDYVMPGMTGGELVMHMRELYPLMKVLFLSGYPSIDTTEPFLAKPFDIDDLVDMVTLLLAQ